MVSLWFIYDTTMVLVCVCAAQRNGHTDRDVSIRVRRKNVPTIDKGVSASADSAKGCAGPSKVRFLSIVLKFLGLTSQLGVKYYVQDISRTLLI